MTIFLICLYPVAAFLGFLTCALLRVAADADRQAERFFAAETKDNTAEKQDDKEADA